MSPVSRPSVLVLSYSPLHRDARVLRQVRLLVDDYDVTTCGYGPSPDPRVVEHRQIPSELVYWHKDRRTTILRLFQRTYDTMPLTRHLRERLGVGEFDIILANDVDAVPLAVSLEPRLGVHADLHEFSSRQKEEDRVWRTFVAPFIRWMVRRWVTRADSVTTVGPGLARQYLKEFGIVAEVVRNAPPYADLAPVPVDRPIRLVHAGNAVPARLEVMLQAMDLVTTDVTLDLYLIDQGSGYVQQLRERFADHPRVRLHDAVPPDEVVPTLNRYDVGVYSLPPISFNFRYALPNKVFDFVQARLGLVVGPSPEMAALVHDHHLGVVADDFTPVGLARALDSLTPDQVTADKAAAAAAAPLLCAEEQVSGWSDAIAALAARGQKP